MGYGELLAVVELLLRHMSAADMFRSRKRNSLLVLYMHHIIVMPRSCIRCGESGVHQLQYCEACQWDMVSFWHRWVPAERCRSSGFTVTCVCGRCSQNDMCHGWVCPIFWERWDKVMPDFNKQKRRRVSVWKDTYLCMDEVELGLDNFSWGQVDIPRLPEAGVVRSLGNEDCIDAACRLKKIHGSCGILNMASAERIGGGVWRGARAQEEEICRRSNLYRHLWNSLSEYPLHGKVLVHKDVVFFKTGAPRYTRFKSGNETRLVVFTSPAVKASWTCNHLDEMCSRVDRLVTEVEKSGVVAMVFGAWGCGSFGLPPEMVAMLFKERLADSSIPVAHFSIKDDNRSGNYSVFRNVLCSQ